MCYRALLLAQEAMNERNHLGHNLFSFAMICWLQRTVSLESSPRRRRPPTATAATCHSPVAASTHYHAGPKYARNHLAGTNTERNSYEQLISFTKRHFYATISSVTTSSTS